MSEYNTSKYFLREYFGRYFQTGSSDPNINIVVPSGSLALSEYAPTVARSGSTDIQLVSGSLSITSSALKEGYGINSVPGSLSLNGQIPDLTVGDNLLVGSGSLSLASVGGSLGLTLTPDSGTLGLVGGTLEGPIFITVGAGVLAFSSSPLELDVPEDDEDNPSNVIMPWTGSSGAGGAFVDLFEGLTRDKPKIKTNKKPYILPQPVDGVQYPTLPTQEQVAAFKVKVLLAYATDPLTLRGLTPPDAATTNFKARVLQEYNNQFRLKKTG